MAFSRGRNCYLIIRRNSGTQLVYPATGTVEAFVGPVSGPQSSQDYPPMGNDYDGQSDATNVILFDVPRSQSAALDLREGDELVITGASAQTNGSYRLLRRGLPVESLNPRHPVKFRCYVRKFN